MNRCHARLTRWETRSPFGTSKTYALKVYVCKNTPREGILCQACSGRSRTAEKYHLRLHGLLTEPIPLNSHIYGGAWYAKQVEKYGEPSQEWIASAMEHQAAAEAWVKPAERGEDTMPPTKAAAKAEVKAAPAPNKAAPAPTKAAPAKAPILPMFPKESFILYKESAKPAVRMMTDSYTMKRGEYEGKPVWILPNGMRFDMDEKGEPKNLIE